MGQKVGISPVRAPAGTPRLEAHVGNVVGFRPRAVPGFFHKYDDPCRCPTVGQRVWLEAVVAPDQNRVGTKFQIFQSWRTDGVAVNTGPTDTFQRSRFQSKNQTPKAPKAPKAPKSTNNTKSNDKPNQHPNLTMSNSPWQSASVAMSQGQGKRLSPSFAALRLDSV